MTRFSAFPRASAAWGIGFMLLGILLFALNDTAGKWLVGTYSVGQVLFFRSAAALLVLAPVFARIGWRTLVRSDRPGLQAIRVVLATLEVTLFYWAVVYLPLADAMTYYLATPIFVAALSPLLLGDRIGWRRWTAILVGFVGVLIALQPTGSTLSAAAWIAIAGTLAFALMMITGRMLKGTPDTVLIFWQMVGALLMGFFTAPFGWVTPTVADLGLLALLGVVATLAHVCITRSLKLASPAVVTPFQYTVLPWAILFGYLVFGDVPTAPMLLGATVIIVAGLYILWREARAGVPATEPAAPG